MLAPIRLIFLEQQIYPKYILNSKKKNKPVIHQITKLCQDI